MDTELLFVVGGYKSGTTTLMGMLNCHDDIYLEGELFGHKKSMARFKKQYPDVISSCNMPNRVDFYKDYIAYMKKNWGREYKYVGEKIATLSMYDIKIVRKHRILFVCRDIRTWLAKPALPNIPICKKKKWPTQFAVEYTELLLRSFMPDKCLRIRMEDMLAYNDMTLKKIGDLIEMPLEKDLSKWWERMGKYDDSDDPKGKMEWWAKQPSSLLGPSKQKRDISVVVNDQYYMWKEILPIFDKYYNSVDKDFLEQEIKQDIRLLHGIKIASARKKDVYKKIDIKKITK